MSEVINVVDMDILEAARLLGKSPDWVAGFADGFYGTNCQAQAEEYRRGYRAGRTFRRELAELPLG